MGFRLTLIALGLSAVAVGRGLPAPRAADASATNSNRSAQKITFDRQVLPLLTTYCTGCHGGRKPKGDLALDVYKDESAALKDQQVWENVVKKLRAHEMPPGKRPQPSEAEARLIADWVDSRFAQLDCTGKKDPGRVTVRRLNRAEYNNTIRDLVGVNFQPADDFPADDVGYGFDNIGDVLSMPPILMEKYLAAAEKIVAEAFKSRELRKRIMVCEPQASEKSRLECAQKIVGQFATQAYRRPATPDEIERLAGLVKLAQAQGDDFDKGVQLAVQAVLVSPHFLFRIERDSDPNNPKAVHPITDFELATRLSYFLWSSMPDEELFKLAREGKLRGDGNLERQALRMLKDTRSHSLVENFAAQWLQTRNLKTVTPDPGTYPTFDEPLREAMQKETELFFESVMKEDRSILDFLDSDYTFVNERLAGHYGIAGVKGEQFRRVSLKGDHRGGVVTQAAVLTVTSNPTRTSPVKRGKWILENLLGAPPPPPPPNVPELNEAKQVVLSGSLRKRMEQHRARADCASCHERMDPLGFGLENFDGIGGWRTRDGQFPVDASGTLPGGVSFQGPRELKGILRAKRDDFARCLADKMLTYALGRGLEPYDRCTVEEVARFVAQKDYRFSALVLGIVKSDAFQMRRGKRS